MDKRVRKISWWKLGLLSFFLFPASGSYKLDGYSFGGGGGVVGDGTYQADVNVGNISNNSWAGLAWEKQSPVPKAPTWENSGSDYNRLHLTIDNSANSSDALFAVAISKDNFVTTQYIKSDFSVGSTLALSDYLNYSAWGGSAGQLISGLETGTTYKVKVRAMQGKFTESAWGPEASAATVLPSISFDIDVSANDEKTDPPYAVNLGDLNPGEVVSSSQKIWIDVGSNALGGASVYVYSQNGGLYSVTSNYNIGATTANLDSVSQGFGIQGVGATQSEGGILQILSPFNGNGNSVGKIDSTVREIFKSENAIEAGRASFVLKAKSDSETPAAPDYGEIITILASGKY